MTYVKICGLTTPDDALVAVDAGADYLGFIFHEKSPRYVTVEQVAAITAQLPANVITVGVFVDAKLETMIDARTRANLSLIQLHGLESSEMLIALGQAYKALRPASLAEWEALAAMYRETLIPRPQTALTPPAPSPSWRGGARGEADSPLPTGAGRGVRASAPTLLIDAYHPALHGGTGLTVDHTLALAAKTRTARLMLAGGLTPDNVGDMVQAVQPFAVDVSSGVELAPGRKDHGKLRAFIQAARTP